MGSMTQPMIRMETDPLTREQQTLLEELSKAKQFIDVDGNRFRFYTKGEEWWTEATLHYGDKYSSKIYDRCGKLAMIFEWGVLLLEEYFSQMNGYWNLRWLGEDGDI